MAKVLVVDDRSENRALIVTLLEHSGHHSLQAADGTEALALVKAERPTLVISDILMPTMDGYEFVRQLRADPKCADTKVIFYTAHYQEDEARNLASVCGISHILLKPCEPEEILRVVDQALARPPQRTAPLAHEFDRQHLRLITDKLSAKANELRIANLRLQREIAKRERAAQKIEHLNRVYALLSGVNSLIVRVRTRDELFKEGCRLAIEHGRFRLAWIGWLDEQTQEIRPLAWAGDDQGYVRFAPLHRSGAAAQRSLAAAAIESRRPVICNDVEAQADQLLHGQEMLARGYRSTVALPLSVGEKTPGVLVLYSEENGFFDAAEMRLLEELAGDISFALDHIEKTQRLDFVAYYDSLTGIANRTFFHERLSQYLGTTARAGRRLALVVADIERFAVINDSFGRHTGDRLLKQLAVRLAHRVGDPNRIARVGATHFATVIPDAGEESEVLRIVENWWREILDVPFMIDGVELRLSARAGIAVFPNDGDGADSLLRNAEAALKRAKASGERHLFYTEHMTERASEKLALENKLRRALENQEFVLYYQPKVDLDTRKIEGVEALIRWQSPERGLVLPAEFIPLMEEIGMIVEAGNWALGQARLDRARWLERKLHAPRIAVNVSTVQLRRQDFVHTVSNVLNLGGAAAGLDIEVTESLIMEDVDRHIEKLKAVRDLGVGIAIDDFGTGYSSLGYLARLPADTLKIDRSFIAAMGDDPNAMTLVSTMISLAHSLNLRVIAEGVESEEQAKILRLLRCDQMQGYLISKPLSFDEMTAWLARSKD